MHVNLSIFYFFHAIFQPVEVLDVEPAFHFREPALQNREPAFQNREPAFHAENQTIDYHMCIWLNEESRNWVSSLFIHCSPDIYLFMPPMYSCSWSLTRQNIIIVFGGFRGDNGEKLHSDRLAVLSFDSKFIVHYRSYRITSLWL